MLSLPEPLAWPVWLLLAFVALPRLLLVAGVLLLALVTLFLEEERQPRAMALLELLIRFAVVLAGRRGGRERTPPTNRLPLE